MVVGHHPLLVPESVFFVAGEEHDDISAFAVLVVSEIRVVHSFGFMRCPAIDGGYGVAFEREEGNGASSSSKRVQKTPIPLIMSVLPPISSTLRAEAIGALLP